MKCGWSWRSIRGRSSSKITNDDDDVWRLTEQLPPKPQPPSKRPPSIQSLLLSIIREIQTLIYDLSLLPGFDFEKVIHKFYTKIHQARKTTRTSPSGKLATAIGLDKTIPYKQNLGYSSLNGNVAQRKFPEQSSITNFLDNINQKQFEKKVIDRLAISTIPEMKKLSDPDERKQYLYTKLRDVLKEEKNKLEQKKKRDDLSIITGVL